MSVITFHIDTKLIEGSYSILTV